MSRERQNAIASFCKLRRLQEATDSGYVRCITCGKVLRWNEADGGHFISRQVKGTEVEPSNVYPQCKECNQLNNGKPDEYREALEQLIGSYGLSRLEDMKSASRGSVSALRRLCDVDAWSATAKKTRDDYIKMKREYDAEIKKIRKEKGL